MLIEPRLANTIKLGKHEIKIVDYVVQILRRSNNYNLNEKLLSKIE